MTATLTTLACRTAGCTYAPHSNGRGYCTACAFAEGVFRHRVDSADGARIVRDLLSLGYTRAAIARAAGMNRQTVSSIGRGAVRTISPDTLHRLNEAKTALADNPSADYDMAKVPTWKSARRIRSLRAAGFTIQEIIDGTGLGETTIADICNGKNPRTVHAIFAAVDSFYRKHEADPVRPAHRIAARNGWRTPMDWDNIDDPLEPEARTEDRAATRDRSEITKEHVDAVQHLVNYYGSVTRVANTLTCTNRVLTTILDGSATTAQTWRLQRITDLSTDIWLGAVFELRNVD